ncbi:hypothetical protein B0H14DRAFT_2607957 [Mycena olivaceomarginata]|nr:hypothetical protein B0H14DRAFT_2607957 [Mycena olivaceomarginata]
MSNPRIVHSSEHWAFLRRRKHECEASRNSAHPRPYPNPIAPAAFDGATVITFIPSRVQPLTSVLLSNGQLVSVSEPAGVTPTPISHLPPPRSPHQRPAPWQQNGKTWAEEDAELLARLALSKAT